ncbi:MAG TPA: hypothetical protein VI457_06175 [Methylococcaceae bacterium]|nr:hypothetical protein [Methylococcaceae bacterium]
MPFIFRPWPLLLLALLCQPAAANPSLEEAVRSLEHDWAHLYYETPHPQQVAEFPYLLERSARLVADYPDRAEPLILRAIVLCTHAGLTWSFSALGKIETARDLLLRAVDLDPAALEGSAYVTLGALYYQVPGWPISFGDDALARRYLETALRHFPEAMDANYFYGDFLAGEGELALAREHLLRAQRAPLRDDMLIADRKMKQDVDIALHQVEEKLGKTDAAAALEPLSAIR